MNALRVALRIFSGKNIYNFAFGATAFAERSVAMKAPVGLLSGRAVCASRWRGFAPTSSAERSKRIFTGGVVEENSICSAAFCESAALGKTNPLRHRCAMPPPPKGGGFARGHSFRQSLRLCHLPQGDGFCAGAAKFTAKAQSLRACLLPLGGAVAQRLRGF